MKKLLLGTVLALGITSAAQADQFVYSGFNVINQQNISFTAPRVITGGAGEIDLHGSGPNAGQTLDVWCIDLLHDLQTSALYNIVPLTNAGAGGGNPTLTNAQLAQMGSLMIHGAASVLNNAFGFDGSAAFQLAIWSIEYPGNLLDNASGALAVLVTALVANVQTGGIWDCPTCTVMQLDVTPQNQVLAFGVDAVPLPATVWLFGGALAGLGALMRRRKQTSVVA